MADPAPSPSAAAALRPLRIMHAAMLASVLIYGLVLVMTTRAEPPPAAATAAPVEPPNPILDVAMAVMAVVTAAALFVFRARKLPRAGRDAMFADGAAPAGTLSRAEYFTICILSWAMAESIAVYGMVLGFVHREVAPFLPFAAASLILLLLLAPRRSHLAGAVAGSDAAG